MIRVEISLTLLANTLLPVKSALSSSTQAQQSCQIVQTHLYRLNWRKMAPMHVSHWYNRHFVKYNFLLWTISASAIEQHIIRAPNSAADSVKDSYSSSCLIADGTALQSSLAQSVVAAVNLLRFCHNLRRMYRCRCNCVCKGRRAIVGVEVPSAHARAVQPSFVHPFR